ncbi:MAG TPA: PEGA domain-containing protein [Actinoplanes sp.]|nr:PEGA domain-containing protein [Actinoplanes sp.]
MRGALPFAILASIACVASNRSNARAAEPDAVPREALRAEAADRFDRGMALLEQGDNAGALAELTRVYQLAPHPRVLFNIGLVYAALNRPVEATRAFDLLLAAPGALPADSLQLARRTRDAEARRVARLDVTTNVPATIEADGVEIGRTPLAEPLAIAAGTRVIAASSPGYLPVRKELTVAGETTATLHVELLPSELRLAHLAIRTNVAEADVFIDGQRVGRTPLPGSVALPLGRRSVEARRAGYQAARHDITLDDGATGELALELAEDTGADAPRGRLVLAVSEPDSDVSIDGRPRGAYRGPLALPPGTHKVTIARAGFLPAERTVSVAEGGESAVEITLLPTPETRAAYKSRTVLRRKLGWAGVLGGGALAVAAGVVVAINRKPLKDAQANLDRIVAQSPCMDGPSQDPPACLDLLGPADDDRNEHQTIQNFGLVALGVGGVALLAGAYLLLTGEDPDRYDHAPPEHDKPEPIALSGWLAPGTGGLWLTGAF